MTGLRLNPFRPLAAPSGAMLLVTALAASLCAEDWPVRTTRVEHASDDSGWREATGSTGWVTSLADTLSPDAAPVTAAVTTMRSNSIAPRMESSLARDEAQLTSVAVPRPLAGSELTSAELSRVALSTATVVVLVLLAAVAWRSLRGRLPRRGQPVLLTLQGSVTLGSRNGLHLVQVEDRQFLIAVDGRGVSCVTPVIRPGDDDLPPVEVDPATSTASWPLHLLPAGGT